jgi:hypothetical protein
LEPFFGLPSHDLDPVLLEVVSGKKTLVSAAEEVTLLKSEANLARDVNSLLMKESFKSKYATIIKLESKKELVEQFKGKDLLIFFS